MIGAVLGAEAKLIRVDYAVDGSEMGERNTDDHVTFGVVVADSHIDIFGKLEALLKGGVHFPVAGNNFLSHYTIVFLKPMQSYKIFSTPVAVIFIQLLKMPKNLAVKLK